MALMPSSSEKEAQQPHVQQHQQQHHLDVPHNPEKDFARLTPVPSATSTVDEALDAEARLPVGEPAAPNKSNDDSDPGPPPNGGFKAWLQVAGSFFLFFNCW